jgi:hypothetical protein
MDTFTHFVELTASWPVMTNGASGKRNFGVIQNPQHRYMIALPDVVQRCLRPVPQRSQLQHRASSVDLCQGFQKVIFTAN